MNMFPENLLNRLSQSRVVAGFSVDKPEDAVPLAEALLAGGIDAIELTLRTPTGIEAVEAIAKNVSGMLIGVGTILTPQQARQVNDAGADFGVAPGLNPNVVRAARDVGLPFAPGIATPSDLEAAMELGCRFVKFFPAAALGGISYLRSMAAPYAHLGIQYFPLGGVNESNLKNYLNEKNIPAVGGSWIVQQELVQNKDWAGIAARAAEAICIATKA